MIKKIALATAVLIAVAIGTTVIVSEASGSNNTATIIAPTNGAAVSGTVSVQVSIDYAPTITNGVSPVVTVYDNGNDLGVATLTSGTFGRGTYSLSWNTVADTNGSYVLTAVSTHRYRHNLTSSPVDVTVSNSSPTTTTTTTTSTTTTSTTTTTTTLPGCTPTVDNTVTPPVDLSLCQPGTPFTASDSIYNIPLPADTPINPNNADYHNVIVYNSCQIQSFTIETTPSCTQKNPQLNITTYSAPLYVVPSNETKYTVTNNCGRPTGYLSEVPGGVPIPSDAQGSPGSDGEIIIYQPSTDSLWEFWRFAGSPSAGFTSCWGGEMDNVSTSNGVFPDHYGADATSLAELGANIRVDELQAGVIDHAIGLEIGDTGSGNLLTSVTPTGVTDPNPGQPGVSLPATHGDGGSSDPNAVPEGTRFRLPATLDCSSYDLTPIGHAICVAGQTYGFIVNDSSPTATLTMRLGDPNAYTNAGLANPYTSGPGVGGASDGGQGFFDGTSLGNQMQNFPWSQLQALPYDYEPTGIVQ